MIDHRIATIAAFLAAALVSIEVRAAPEPEPTPVVSASGPLRSYGVSLSGRF